jgi:hypothetical protein
VVLGAGATRACSFVKPHERSCIPPLDADFFTQLQRVPAGKHQIQITAVMRDVVQLFGGNFAVSLETVFATLEHTIRMLKTTGSERAYKRSDLEAMRDRLLGAIAIAMEASIAHRSDGKPSRFPRDCKSHSRLVRDILEPGDHIISFNYDCVIDHALRTSGDGKWSARYGYGFDLGPRGRNLDGDAAWNPKEEAARDGTIHLHKLHGSLHFQFKGETSRKVRLKERPYTKQSGTPRYSIIPPESNKAYDKGLFALLWKNAAAAIARANYIVVIGYSLPVTDLHATALFRTSVKPGGLRSLVVVNPDRDARRRARSVLQRGLSDDTRVLSFDRFEEFLATTRSAWRQ